MGKHDLWTTLTKLILMQKIVIAMQLKDARTSYRLRHESGTCCSDARVREYLRLPNKTTPPNDAR
jgi:hypothetical protein